LNANNSIDLSTNNPITIKEDIVGNSEDEYEEWDSDDSDTERKKRNEDLILMTQRQKFQI